MFLSLGLSLGARFTLLLISPQPQFYWKKIDDYFYLVFTTFSHFPGRFRKKKVSLLLLDVQDMSNLDWGSFFRNVLGNRSSGETEMEDSFTIRGWGMDEDNASTEEEQVCPRRISCLFERYDELNHDLFHSAISH